MVKPKVQAGDYGTVTISKDGREVYFGNCYVEELESFTGNYHGITNLRNEYVGYDCNCEVSVRPTMIFCINWYEKIKTDNRCALAHKIKLVNMRGLRRQHFLKRRGLDARGVPKTF